MFKKTVNDLKALTETHHTAQVDVHIDARPIVKQATKLAFTLGAVHVAHTVAMRVLDVKLPQS